MCSYDVARTGFTRRHGNYWGVCVKFNSRRPPDDVIGLKQRLGDRFLGLTFQLETGKALPVFTRFEGPISVAIHGRIPAPLPAELNRLINRLRSEADIDIF